MLCSVCQCSGGTETRDVEWCGGEWCGVEWRVGCTCMGSGRYRVSVNNTCVPPTPFPFPVPLETAKSLLLILQRAFGGENYGAFRPFSNEPMFIFADSNSFVL